MPDDKTPIAMGLNILGDLEIERNGERLPLPDTAAACHLLALFAVKARYEDQELVDVLWPGDSLTDPRIGMPKAVRARLDRAVSDARAALRVNAASGVLKREHGIVHRVRGDTVAITTDLDDFRRLLRSDRADDWRSALALVRGPIAQYLPVKSTRTDWLDTEREKQRNDVKILLKRVDASTSGEVETQVDDLLAGHYMDSPAMLSSSESSDTSSEPVETASDTAVPPLALSRLRSIPLGRRRRKKHYVAVGLVAALIVLAGIVLVMRSDSSTTIPSEGSVVNADTGGVVSDPQATASHFPAQLAAGSIFRACDLSVRASCGGGHSGPIPIKVKVGDIVAFRVELNDGYSTPIHYLRLIGNSQKRVLVTDAQTRPEKTEPSKTELEIYISVKWPEILDGHEIVDEPGYLGHDAAGPQPIEPVYLQLPRPGEYRLEYIPGSTALVDKATHFSHSLPDGILSVGIALENVGPPSSCFWCAQQYIRYVYFHMRVTDKPE